MEQKVEFLRRISDSLRGWTNSNPVVKRGNLICVSTNDDGVFDITFMADGKSSFLQQLDNWKNGISTDGQGLTEAEREHLREALTKDDLGEIEATLKNLVDLVGEDTDGIINKFNEIVAFLAGIADSSTLEGIIGGISSQISALSERIDDVEGKVNAIDLTPFETSEHAADTYQPKGNYLTEHQDISGKADADDVYTKTEIDEKGYLTEHQSLDNYYTKEQVNEKIPTTYAFDKMENIVVDGKTYTVKGILTALLPLLDETIAVVNQ